MLIILKIKFHDKNIFFTKADKNNFWRGIKGNDIDLFYRLLSNITDLWFTDRGRLSYLTSLGTVI